MQCPTTMTTLRLLVEHERLKTKPVLTDTDVSRRLVVHEELSLRVNIAKHRLTHKKSR